MQKIVTATSARVGIDAMQKKQRTKDKNNRKQIGKAVFCFFSEDSEISERNF